MTPPYGIQPFSAFRDVSASDSKGGMVGVRDVVGGVEWEEEEEEDDEEALLVVALLVKGVVEGVGVSATFCFFVLSFKAPM